MALNQREKARRFLALHGEPGAFVMPNAWDAGSALLLAAEGFPAVATTSAGVAFARGLPDYQDRIDRDEMLAVCRAIADAVDLPVSGDLEAGYGEAPEAVAETIRRSVAAGLVGGSIEDHSGDPDRPLYDRVLAVERIRAAKEAAAASGIPYVLTARAECYLVGHPDPLAESIARCNLYREAGADCLYAAGVSDPEEIATLAREIDGPLNVVMGLAGAALTVRQLADLGVKRISVGGSLARLALGALRRAAREIAKDGRFTYAAEAIPDAELTAFFSGREAREAP